MTWYAWILVAPFFVSGFAILVLLAHSAWLGMRYWLLGFRVRLALRLLPRQLREPSIVFWREKTLEQARLATFAATAQAVAEYQQRARETAPWN